MSETTTFKCANCKKVFDKVRPDEEAKAEMKGLWGDIPENEQIVVCKDCFNSFMDWYNRTAEAKQ